MTTDLPAIEETYEFLLQLTIRLEKCPRSLRPSVGRRLEGEANDLLADLIRAKFSRNGPDKVGILRECNLRLEVLRFQLRIAHTLRVFSHDAHHHLLTRMQSLGCQIGGWIKSLTEKKTA